MNKLKYSLQLLLLLAFSLFLGSGIMSCANIVPPSGGPKDTIAPRLLSITPKDSSLNTYIKKLELVFDKYMVNADASKLSISPAPTRTPTVEVRLKKVILTFPDSAFSAQTTYTINLSGVFKDNREGIEFSNYQYTFSTGSYFDSLSVKGFAFDAEKVNIDTGLKAVLYLDSDFKDSTIFRKKPLYVTPVKADGSFTFLHLPERKFRMFVLKDENKNLIYDKGDDKIGFLSEAFLPSFNPDTIYSFRYFKEIKDSTNLTIETPEPERRGSTKPPVAHFDWKENEVYRVLVDTQNINKGTQDITKDLEIKIQPIIKTLHKDKIFLSFEKELVDVEAIHTLTTTDTNLKLKTQWQEGCIYTLRLVKGWAIDTSGKELPPGKYIFRAKKSEDYGTLKVSFQDSFLNGNYWFQLLRDGQVEKAFLLKDSLQVFDLLHPGLYQIFLTQDMDQNKAWTTGNYLQKLQPEWNIKNQQNIQLKPGWEMEETFIPIYNPTPKIANVNQRSGTQPKDEQEDKN